jgi:hypothetical protein
MKHSDLPLVMPRSEKLTAEVLRFIAECAKYYPGCEKDVIVIRKPGTGLYRGNKEEGPPVNDPIPL